MRRLRATADRDKQNVGAQRLATLEGDGDALGVLSDRLEANADLGLDSPLAECAVEGLGHGLVLVGHESRQRLDDGHVGAEGLPDTGELDADHAAAEHDGRGGDVVEGECLGGGDDASADLETGERP